MVSIGLALLLSFIELHFSVSYAQSASHPMKTKFSLKGTKKHASRENVAANLGGILAAAQVGLARAQLEQGHAVERARKQIAKVLDTESDAMAKTIEGVGHELATASLGLKRTINDAKSAIALKASNPDDDRWDSPAQTARARLSAEISLAERGLQRVERKHKRNLQLMASRGLDLLQDGTHKFSQRLGDLDELLTPAKQRLEAAAASTSEPAAPNPRQGSEVASLTKDFSRMHDMMAQARKQIDMVELAVDKRFDEAIRKAAASVQAHTKEVDDNLEAAHKKELKRVRSVASFGV